MGKIRVTEWINYSCAALLREAFPCPLYHTADGAAGYVQAPCGLLRGEAVQEEHHDRLSFNQKASKDFFKII